MSSKSKVSCAAGARHRWEPVGGNRENPGYMSRGGTTLTFSERCVRCDCRRVKTWHGSQRNPGERDTLRYFPADVEVEP